MHTHKYLAHTATPLKTFCVLLVLMFLLGIGQLIIIQIHWEFSRAHGTPAQPAVEQNEQEKQQWDIHNSQKAFTPDGTVYLVNDNMTDPSGFNKKKIIVKDQHSKILFEGKEEDNPYLFIQWYPKKTDRYRHYLNIDQRHLNELNLIGGNFSRHYVVPMVDIHNRRIGHWFFDTNKRIFKYYTVSGQQLGYLGTNGYTENQSNAIGFMDCQKMINWVRPNSFDPIMIYQDQHSVYQIDFQNKQVNTLVKTEKDPIRHMVLTNWQETEVYDYRPALTILTNSNKLYLHLKRPEQTIETQLPSDFYTRMARFAADNNTIFARLEDYPEAPKTNDWNVFVTWYRENRNKAKEHRVRLFEVDRMESFTEKSSFVWIEPARHPNIVHRTLPDTASRLANSLSSPVPMWLTRHLLKTGNYRQGPVWSRETMQFVRGYSTFKTPINLCVMTVCAIITFLHGWPRRTHIARLTFWIVFVFLFNLPGLLTYLALNHTPIVHCENCNKKRGLMQDVCCRCGTTLPLPKRKETDLVMPIPT